METDIHIKKFKDDFRTTPKKSGKPYSKSYIENVSYYVAKLIKDKEFHFDPDSNDITDQISIINRFIRNESEKKKHVAHVIPRYFRTYLRYLKKPEEMISKIKIPPKIVRDPRREKTFSKDEIEQLMKNTRNPSDVLIIKLLFYGSLKKYQIPLIKVADIDFKNGKIFVEEDGTRIGKDIDDKLKQDLKNYKDNMNLKNNDLVFPGLTEYIIWYRIKKLGNEILRKPINPQEITITRIKDLMNNGASESEVAAMTNRSARTISSYPTISEKRKKELLEKYSN